MALLSSAASVMLLNPSRPLHQRKKSTALRLTPSPSHNKLAARRLAVQACFSPFEDQPILRDALKEPVAFLGGVFAGLLRLDLNEDPLKEWIARTVEAAGVEGIASGDEAVGGDDDEPQEIQIE